MIRFILAAILLALSVTPVQAQTDSCLSNAAFCDPLATPSVNGGRAGNMAPVWGASRVGGEGNVFQNIDNGVADVTNAEGTAVNSPNDIQIINGHLEESINDNGGLAQVNMYPRQPFDFAGRTGKIAFNVSDDSGGSHAAWPEISITDQPIPNPGPSQIAFAGVLLPRNSINISFAGAFAPGTGLNTNPTQRCVSIDNVWITSNYSMTQGLAVQDGCVLEPAFNSLVMNHFEVDVNATGLTVFGTDAGTTAPLKQIGHASFTAPLTRGLVWMKDVHYNANKGTCENSPLPCQQSHTFAWSDFSFDGPVLTQDVGFELPDGQTQRDTAQSGQPVRDIGQVVAANSAATLTFNNVSPVENASAVLLEMSYWEGSLPTSITYSANGNAAHTLTGPTGSECNWCRETIALPLPTSEVVDGTDTLSVTLNGQTNPVGIDNVDLILAGAGAPVSTAPIPTPTPTPQPTPTPTPCLVDTNQGQFTRPAAFCTNQ